MEGRKLRIEGKQTIREGEMKELKRGTNEEKESYGRRVGRNKEGSIVEEGIGREVVILL